jgi:hypothetical protein
MMANTPVAVTPRSEKFPALQYLRTAELHRVFPTNDKPVPGKKVSRRLCARNIVFDAQIVRFDRIARCGHNCMYVNPVEG